MLCIYFYLVDYETHADVNTKYYFLYGFIVLNSVINPFLYDGISLENPRKWCLLSEEYCTDGDEDSYQPRAKQDVVATQNGTKLKSAMKNGLIDCEDTKC